jgi:hypothetical protein
MDLIIGAILARLSIGLMKWQGKEIKKDCKKIKKACSGSLMTNFLVKAMPKEKD